MQRVLVTGATGFIGGHLSMALKAMGLHLTLMTRAEVGSAPWSIASWLNALRHSQPDTIFHLAGASDGGDRILEEANILSARSLYNAIDIWGRRPLVILAGSAAEYGAPPPNGILHEAHKCTPTSAYGRTKLAQTTEGLRWAATTSGRLVAARIFNPIGARMPKRLALADFANQILALPATGGRIKCGDLNVARDFLSVEDACAQLLKIASTPAAEGQIVNVCSGTATRLDTLLHLLIERMGKPVRIEVDPSRLRPISTPLLVGSTARLLSLGVTPAAVDAPAMIEKICSGLRETQRG